MGNLKSELDLGGILPGPTGASRFPLDEAVLRGPVTDESRAHPGHHKMQEDQIQITMNTRDAFWWITGPIENNTCKAALGEIKSLICF